MVGAVALMACTCCSGAVWKVGCTMAEAVYDWSARVGAVVSS